MTVVSDNDLYFWDPNVKICLFRQMNFMQLLETDRKNIVAVTLVLLLSNKTELWQSDCMIILI